jgi:asparaginyl-tRNA synthetase
VFTRVLDRCPDDMAFFNERIDKTVLETLHHIVETPFERISYTDAIEILERSGETFEFPVKWGTDLQSEHERFLTEKHIKKPIVVTDYPAAIKAFYMYLNDDERTVRAMDVLVPKVGEIIGGSQREHRLDQLKRRMVDQGLDEGAYWWYLDLRRYGTAPHSGFGLGFERIVQFMTGMANIRDVIPFPRVPGWAEF